MITIRSQIELLLVGLTCLTVPASSIAEELRVPAFTAYMLPNPGSARISEQQGVTRWTDATQSVNWYGRFEATGPVTVQLALRLPSNAVSRLKMTVDGESRETTVRGTGLDSLVTADFGTFAVAAKGYRRFALESLNDPEQPFGDLDALLLNGQALAGAHFNLKERRNAASVHLFYPIPDGTEAAAFYCEVTAVEDPVTTFYMACGWHRGYFGMQVNSPTERRIIFSVWDSGNEAVDRKKVADQNRVTLQGKGEGVYSGDFGNEGTGGHSHLKYLWKTGETQRFVVTAEPVETTFTIFSGYWFHPEQQEWMLISSWKAPKEGGLLRGLHSFSENFSGHNGHLLRKARFGNQWVRSPNGNWTELTSARFSHDPTGRRDRFDRFMGTEQGQFFLSHGGFGDGFTESGAMFRRDPIGQSPGELRLPPIRSVSPASGQ